jgi:hypothetical protein
MWSLSSLVLCGPYIHPLHVNRTSYESTRETTSEELGIAPAHPWLETPSGSNTAFVTHFCNHALGSPDGKNMQVIQNIYNEVLRC